MLGTLLRSRNTFTGKRDFCPLKAGKTDKAIVTLGVTS